MAYAIYSKANTNEFRVQDKAKPIKTRVKIHLKDHTEVFLGVLSTKSLFHLSFYFIAERPRIRLTFYEFANR